MRSLTNNFIMSSKHRRSVRRRKSWEYGDDSITIRVSNRHSPRRYDAISVTSARDAPRFARLIQDQVHATPRDPLIVAVNGYQPWLEDILVSCVQDDWSDIADLDREVQFAGTMQFPEKASKRGRDVPWTFIMDHMNVPQVYFWSVDMNPPKFEDFGLPEIEYYRFRVGVWQSGRGACRFDRDVPVVMIFTKNTPVCEHVVSELLFPYLHKDQDFNLPREDEEGICWTFSRLYYLLTDWQNIIGEVVTRLGEAETNSHSRHLPVKWRTRLLHTEVDRLFELKEYLHFQSRAFKKLQKLKANVPKNEQQDPLWDDMDDAVEDLDQWDTTLDSLKERFNNLIELEFNIQNAVQSDNSQFLSVIATLFLPVSFMASVFGITTITWPPIWYLYAALPVLVVSAIFTFAFPWSVRQFQKLLYPIEELRIHLQPRNFTMLGDELPDSVDVQGGNRQGKGKRKAQRPAAMDGARARSGSKYRSEKDDE
ncbi:Hypothetical protein R9X50_00056100 [Acrodontium crateriforme]|uniref:Uncharacterized protein n=1 Tax=Acrodontium crateriforme TaxID=150365 RepID=A0AAQ3R725_9PEZI|nr:Hypothetical protein R9X50_00056100 [Acrodontium crateriforme]